MDDVDLGILREIGLEPFTAGPRAARPWRPEVLANRLGKSPRLIKDRLARLEREGLIKRYDIQPNLTLLGLTARTYAFDFPTRADQRETLDRLGKVDGVIAFVEYVTSWLTVTLAFRDAPEHDRRLGTIRALLGGAAPQTWFEPYPPAPKRKPTRLDWRLLRSLRADASRPLHELAATLGVSTKTVRRRMDQLAAEGAFDTFVQLHARGMDELLMCSVVFRVEPSSAQESIQTIHSELLSSAWSHCSAPFLEDGLHYDLVALPRTPRGLAAFLEAAARVPGVIEVKGHLATSVTWTPQWLDGEIDRRILEGA